MHCIIGAAVLLQLSSSTYIGRSTGSLRKGAIASSGETFTVGNDPEASPGTAQIISSGQRTLSSPLGGASDGRHASSGKNNAGGKNFDTTLKGIESLRFDD